MDEPPVFQVNADVVWLALSSAPGPEKDEVALAQFSPSYPLAVMLQHVGSRTRELLAIDFPVNNRYKAGAIHPALRQSAHPMGDAKPVCACIVEVDIVVRRQSHAVKSREFLGSLEVGRKDYFFLPARTARAENACHQDGEQQ